jgi:hypothetical protein
MNTAIGVIFTLLLALISWMLGRLFKRLENIETVLHKAPCGELRNLLGRFDERGDAEKQLMNALVILRELQSKRSRDD